MVSLDSCSSNKGTRTHVHFFATDTDVTNIDASSGTNLFHIAHVEMNSNDNMCHFIERRVGYLGVSNRAHLAQHRPG